MRLVVYTDYAYHRQNGRILAERAFAKFLGRVAAAAGGMTVVGRLDPAAAGGRYELPPEVRFVALPYYESLSRPGSALAALPRSLVPFWNALDDADGAWLLGPHPLGPLFALLALIRGRRVILGVRQDMRSYVRARHPGRRGLNLAAFLLEASYRVLCRLCPTVVVGPDLAQRYRGARRLLEITVSLVSERELVSSEELRARSYAGELTVLSVGRLDAEKNPLMLADVLSGLERAQPGRWRLAVCGEGPLADALQTRLTDRGLQDRVELAGYVAFEQLRERYLGAHVLLSTSWTEGFPQVLVEAFAAGLPAVCTDVGGIAAGADGAVVLVAPGDVGAAIEAVRGLADDAHERERLTARALAFAAEHTIEREVERLVAFLARPERPSSRRRRRRFATWFE